MCRPHMYCFPFTIHEVTWTHFLCHIYKASLYYNSAPARDSLHLCRHMSFELPARKMAAKVETATLFDALLFGEDVDDRQDDVVARGSMVMFSTASEQVDGSDGRTEKTQRAAIKEIGAYLQSVADGLESENPGFSAGAAKEVVDLLSSSAPADEVEQKFEKIAMKSIRLTDPDTATNLAAAGAVYCIGKKAIGMLGGEHSSVSRMVGDYVKKFLTFRFGSFFSRDEQSGKWVRY